jgi:hypothetical protein
MVTQVQVQNAIPVYNSIVSLNTLVSEINIGAVNGWQVIGLLQFRDNAGNLQTLDLSAIPPAILLNSLFTMAENQIAVQTSALAGI